MPQQTSVMPFDQRQRYEVVAAVAAALPAASSVSVLDVGGYYQDLDGRPGLPIRQVLPHATCVTIDRESGRFVSETGSVSLPGYARADAAALPFADDSFDLVACLDVLEHVPRPRRPDVIRELFRVARTCVVVAVPTADDGADTREARLDAFIQSLLHSEHQQLKEHREFGLPTDAEMRQHLPEGTRSFGFGNADRWLLMMLAKYYLLALPYNLEAFHDLDEAYATLDASPDRTDPFYRRFYLTAARPDVSPEILDSIVSQYAPLAARPEAGGQLAGWIFERLARTDSGRLAAARAPLEAEIGSLRRQVAALESTMREFERTVQDLNLAHAHVVGILRDVEASRTYRLSRFLRRLFPKRA